MFSFNVDGKEYKVKYGYGVLANTDLIDRISSLGTQESGSEVFKNMIETLGELILVGLQKYHKDEFGYDTDSEKEEVLSKVYDILDEYEDESTEEEEKNCYTLFEKATEELMNNGFLSKVMKAEESQNRKTKKKI